MSNVRKKLPQIEIDKPWTHGTDQSASGAVSARSALRARQVANWNVQLLSLKSGRVSNGGKYSARNKSRVQSARARASEKLGSGDKSSGEDDAKSSRSMYQLDFSMLSQRDQVLQRAGFLEADEPVDPEEKMRWFLEKKNAKFIRSDDNNKHHSRRSQNS